MKQSSWKHFLKKPGWLRRPTRSDLLLMIASLFIATVIWAYIVSRSGYSLRFSNLPVIVDTTDSKAASYRLTAMSPETGDITVSAELSGSRTEIGGLSRNDLEAYVDFDAVVTDTAGYHTLPIRLRRKNGTVLKNASLSVSSAEVKMDKIQSVELNVEVSCPNVSGALDPKNKIVIDKEHITAEPKTVTVSGPSEVLSKLSHVRVWMNEAEKLSQTKVFTGCTDFDLIGADNGVVSKSGLKVEQQFDITVPVYYLRELPVTLTIPDAPKRFDTEWLLRRLRLVTDREYQLPQYAEDENDILKIVIETSDLKNKEKLDQKDEWVIGIDPSSLSLGGDYKADVKLEDGYTNHSNLDKITVSMDESDLVAETRWIFNTDIQCINGASGYDYSIGSGRTRITIIGTAEEVAQISGSDIKASVSLYNAEISESGSITSPQTLTITLPEELGHVWVSPQVKVNITATPVSGLATTAP